MDYVDYNTVKRDYEDRVRRLSRAYGNPTDQEMFRRVTDGVRRRVVKFTNGRVTFGPQARVRSRASAE